MEKRIRKKATLYGLAAILMASVFATLCINLGVNVPASIAFALPPVAASPSAFLSKFSSMEALKGFLVESSTYYGRFSLYGPLDLSTDSPLLQAKSNAQFAENGPVYDHSTTNIQVSGVDETDTVKTDDEGFIYVISGKSVLIVRGYPLENARIYKRIEQDTMYPFGIFVSGNRLAVLGSQYLPVWLGHNYRYYETEIRTFVRVYDITDRALPILLRDLTFTGSYFNSRMIGDHLYFVISQPAYMENEVVPMPKIFYEGKTAEIQPTSIFYCNGSAQYYQFTNFVSLNIQNTTEAPKYLTIMLGSTSGMYVSNENLYTTFQTWNGNTTIYRLHINEGNLTCDAKGEVIGHELNQYAMDEHEEYFRIITTSWANGSVSTSVYVLSMNLTVIGKLEKLAMGETFHSSRFMGDRCYLVTFRQVDPLFAINLTDPTQPRVLGELKTPGYSDYLHAFDETHLIGVGKDTVDSFYQGIKISLFDVSNVSNPTQTWQYVIGTRGSESPALQDPKAFLFSKSRNLLVLPVLVAEINGTEYPYDVPPYTYGQAVWQGAYVFNATLEHGFVLKGRITHLPPGTDVWEQTYHIKRTLYIEDVLYTISDRKIMMNSLEDLALLGELPLP